MPVSGLRTCLVGMEEMTFGDLVILLRGVRYWSLGRFQTGEKEADMQREAEGRSGLTSALTTAPHIHKMTLRKKKIVLFICLFLPYILPAAFINICHFPGA